MTTTTDNKVSAAQALSAAEARYRSTQAAADAAHAAASRQALDDAETAAVQAIADAVSGTGDRATADAARARVEQLRRDHEWAQVELQAAERATGLAYDDVVRARRGVTAEEYLAAHAAHNDKSTRVNQLLEQLPALLKSSSTSQRMSGRPSISLQANLSWGAARPERGPSSCGRQHSSTS